MGSDDLKTASAAPEGRSSGWEQEVGVLVGSWGEGGGGKVMRLFAVIVWRGVGTGVVIVVVRVVMEIGMDEEDPKIQGPR